MQGHAIVASSSAALALGFVHTLLGPDHYAPFVAMSRIGNWSIRKTLLVTLACGLGHIASSVLIGLAGVWLGVEVLALKSIESLRADIAAWLLLAFGITYTAWGIWRGIKNRPHTHIHVHADGVVHAHEHVHDQEHAHVHQPIESTDATKTSAKVSRMTPWVLFTIFVFGPCEPLIPLLFYPASRGQTGGVLWVASLFALATLVTMIAMVLILRRGTELLSLSRWRRFDHALAGCVVLMCGAALMLGY